MITHSLFNKIFSWHSEKGGAALTSSFYSLAKSPQTPKGVLLSVANRKAWPKALDSVSSLNRTSALGIMFFYGVIHLASLFVSKINTDSIKVIISGGKKSLQIIHLRSEIAKGPTLNAVQICEVQMFCFHRINGVWKPGHFLLTYVSLSDLSPILVASAISPEMSTSTP